MAKKILVGSGFKMRKSVSESIEYARIIFDFIKENISDLKLVEVFILASFEALYPMSRVISGSEILKLGAQNCWYEDCGPYTGEVSPKNLKEIGCSYVEVGHPERRSIFNEDSGLINKKIKACIRNGLKPILFIGEKKKYNKKSQVYSSLEEQLTKELVGLSADDLVNVILAYEPVWAIGAEAAAPVEHIQDSLGFLRDFFISRFSEIVSRNQTIFYGGSVKLDNSLKILRIRGNDGISSGRGAMDPGYFIEMIKVAAAVSKNRLPDDNL